ncbi:flagellar protein FlaG [Massilia sp. 9I]|uniref:flagellar protein FlaG n=1 Tax=Massilia sp. 9I TaxID=2653152 RepID=UPI0012F1559F|nr:flagellar protein FlaG [Massilia sp. 9I]VXC67301.1 Flagellin protein flaG [Massilia sp. 9I]
MNIQSLGSPVAAPLVAPDQPAAGPVKAAVAAKAVEGREAEAAAAPSREQVGDAVKKINDGMRASSQSLEFAIDEDSKDIVVKIIDQNTREVVRQIPSVEALEIAKSLDKMRGLLISQTA